MSVLECPQGPILDDRIGLSSHGYDVHAEAPALSEARRKRGRKGIEKSHPKRVTLKVSKQLSGVIQAAVPS